MPYGTTPDDVGTESFGYGPEVRKKIMVPFVSKISTSRKAQMVPSFKYFKKLYRRILNKKFEYYQKHTQVASHIKNSSFKNLRMFKNMPEVTSSPSINNLSLSNKHALVVA